MHIADSPSFRCFIVSRPLPVCFAVVPPARYTAQFIKTLEIQPANLTEGTGEKSELGNPKLCDWKRFHAIVDDIISKKELIEEAKTTGLNIVDYRSNTEADAHSNRNASPNSAPECLCCKQTTHRSMKCTSVPMAQRAAFLTETNCAKIVDDQIMASTHVASKNADYVDRNATPRYTTPKSKVTQLQQLYSLGNPDTLHTGRETPRLTTFGSSDMKEKTCTCKDRLRETEG
ncbi:unnamed protein product [Heligmosomoides polygyrus]|uniref:Reverse transcriptase domain-containing protein n=1 Tax=Heligmosomoides polygyrus TaxID=6339 RepID=A0A183GTE5_HELPZ|nr:unnamed protein product [Heligmosomoides polygyrus]